MTNPELEYNLAGGLVLTRKQEDFTRLCEGIVEAGYGHACVLPFRALVDKEKISELKDSPLTIVHIEDALNPTNQDNFELAVAAGIIGKLRRFMGDKSKPPIVRDAFFPSKKTRIRSESWLLEVNPGINLTAQEILALSDERGFGLIFDPSHLLPTGSALSLLGQATNTPRGEWEKQFQFFRSGLEVVDIHGDPKKLFRESGELRELAQAAKETKSVRFLRVEIQIPPILQLSGKRQSQEKGFELLREVGQALREA